MYDGEWSAGKMHGRGTWTGHLVYEGEWRDGLQHGHGRSAHLDGGVIYVGEWRRGKWASLNWYRVRWHLGWLGAHLFYPACGVAMVMLALAVAFAGSPS